MEQNPLNQQLAEAGLSNSIGNKLRELETLISDYSRMTGKKYIIKTHTPDKDAYFFTMNDHLEDQPSPDAATPPTSPSIDAMTKAVEQMESITANVTAAADDHFKALGKYSPETFARATAQMKENVNIAHNLNRLLSESVQFRSALEELKMLKDQLKRYQDDYIEKFNQQHTRL